MSTLRILVTGSRDWDDRTALEKALWDVYDELGGEHDSVVVVHGACPTGADQMAAEWVGWTSHWDAGLDDEPHPADWSKGRRAGPDRNTEMVAAGADVCLAFIKNGSRGATDCADKAEAAGIETRRFTA